jgi:hypothetical protein
MLSNSQIINNISKMEISATVITLGTDWLVKVYVKEHHLQDNLRSVYVRVGDLPWMVHQYGIELCNTRGGGVSVLSCKEVHPESGAYLMEDVSACRGGDYLQASSVGIWRDSFVPGTLSTWLGEDVSIRIPDSGQFRSVQELDSSASLESKVTRRVAYRCAGNRYCACSGDGETLIEGLELPRMVRLVICVAESINEEKDNAEHPCAIELALQFRRFSMPGECKIAYSLTVLGERLSENDSRSKAEILGGMAYSEAFMKEHLAIRKQGGLFRWTTSRFKNGREVRSALLSSLLQVADRNM